MGGNPIDISLRVNTPISDPALDGNLKGQINLGSVKEFIPLEKDEELNGIITSDISLNGRMSMIENEKYDEFKASGTFQITDMKYRTKSVTYPIDIRKLLLTFTPKFVELNSFESQIGNSDITAFGKIKDFMQYVFKDSLLKGNFTMNSKMMDIDELMGPETTDTVSASADTVPLSVIPVPANIDFTLNSSIGKIKYDNLDISGVNGLIHIKNERITMEKLKMNLLDGSVTMNGFYDTKNQKKPLIKYNLEINELDIQKTFAAFNTVQKLAPIGKYAFGKFSTTLENLNGTLTEEMMPDLNTITANGSLRTKSVRVEGFEPVVKLAENLKNESLKKLDLQNIAAFFHVKDGRVIVDPFKTKIKNIDAEIAGSTGYDQTIDYNWNLKIPTKDLPAQATTLVEGWLSKASASAGKEIKLPEKIDVTALIGGTVTKPVIKTGMKDAMKDVKNEVKEELKEIVEEKKEELINKGKEEAAKEAEKILSEARTQAERIKSEAATLSAQVKKEGYDKADQLEKSGSNPIEKIANKKLAEKLRKETDQKCQKITEEANAKADKVLQEAQEKADKLK
jgi:vacuolar-type H+-ATPase subunit H